MTAGSICTRLTSCRPVIDDLDHAAAGFAGDLEIGDLGLRLLHVGLQRLRLFA